jgi:phenylalanyl-tRNA synthetase beta chain
VRLPLSWLREYVALPESLTPREIAAGLVRLGIEVESVTSTADDLTGPVTVGRVRSAEGFTASNGKTIRWCQVDVGEGEPRGIICGAPNARAGITVAVALPGAVLPGGFRISARRTYGHLSDGMLASARELGVGEDHDGILELPADAPVGADAIALLGLHDVVFELETTSDRGYQSSVRGIARELSHAFGVPFTDPALVDVPDPDGTGPTVTIEDPAGCDRFTARTVTGLDPAAPSPLEIRRRLALAGIRSISLAVDVTNYVMVETGQPMHAFDAARLSGPIVVRRARAGETLETLDGVRRTLDADDLLVTDPSGPIALAGIMGGASTEIGASTSEVVLEAAHWDPATISRGVRRHKLPSEAAKRFERGVDPAVAGPALTRAVALLVEHGGAASAGGGTVAGPGPTPVTVPLPADRPERVAGFPIPAPVTVARLREIGCQVDAAAGAGPSDVTGSPGAGSTGSSGSSGSSGGVGSSGSSGGVGSAGGAADVPAGALLRVVPPSWRQDLRDPADLVEEVVRLEGYDKIPSTLPTPPPGLGLTEAQRTRRAVGRALAAAGLVEVLTSPFVSAESADQLGLPDGDPRRTALRLLNPLSEAEPELRTTLLPGLLGALRRNVGRGLRDIALYETGLVFLPTAELPPLPSPGVSGRPSEPELAALLAGIPDQPRHVGAVLAGTLDPAGWWGAGRTAGWQDAIEAARVVAAAARVPLSVRAAQQAPWHPGRCAALLAGDTVVGHAGELHPRVVAALELPERTCAMELDLDALGSGGIVHAPVLSAYPPALLDVALVVGADVPAASVADALRSGAGPLLESLRLFDVYADDDRLGAGMRSLAYALRLRAPDRTLTAEEAAAARDAAVAEAGRRTGATLRS